MERLFERLLWGSRLVVLVAVVAGVVLALGGAYLASIDVVHFFEVLFAYAEPGLAAETRNGLRNEAVTTIVKALDGYLISAILIVFSLGLYELFVNRIDAAERSAAASRLLYVRSLDDLKDKVVRLVLLVLAIEFFQRALRSSYDSPLDLLYLAGGILLISGAFYLIRVQSERKNPDEPGKDR